jgi:hypothetical protein
MDEVFLTDTQVEQRWNVADGCLSEMRPLVNGPRSHRDRASARFAPQPSQLASCGATCELCDGDHSQLGRFVVELTTRPNVE